MAESSNQERRDFCLSSATCSRRSFALGMVAHAAAVILAAVVIYTAWPGSSLFSWHPTLMVTGYGLLMTEAILMFSPESSLMINAMRKSKVRFHWILQAGAVVCAVGGLMAIYLNKERMGKDHFVSWHGLIGVTTVVFSVVQSMGGINLLYPKLLKSWMTLAQLKMYHATFGLLGYALACGSLALGINSNWFSQEVEGMLWVVCLCCPAILALVIMQQVTTAYLGRRIKI
ncbi:transmembrane reductase CYB561D2-like [Branchiostoma floridae x Branchiostoma japonicum]